MERANFVWPLNQGQSQSSCKNADERGQMLQSRTSTTLIDRHALTSPRPATAIATAWPGNLQRPAGPVVAATCYVPLPPRNRQSFRLVRVVTG
jgi:hypothetical protein